MSHIIPSHYDIYTDLKNGDHVSLGLLEAKYKTLFERWTELHDQLGTQNEDKRKSINSGSKTRDEDSA